MMGRCFHQSGTTLLTGSDEQMDRFRNRGILTKKLQTASGSGKGGKDKRKAVTWSLNCKLRDEAEIEEVLQKLQKLSKLVRTNAADSHSGIEDKYGFNFRLCKYVIGVGDEEDTVAELVEWPRLKGSRVEYPIGSSRFREFCKAKSSIDGIWGHAFGYRGNFFRTCSVSQEGDYLYLIPDLAKKNKCRCLGDEVSLEYVQGVVKDSRTDGFCCYLAQFDYGLTLPLSNLAKSVMNMIGACPTQFERRITAKDFLEYYAMNVTSTDGAYLSSSSSRQCFFDLSSAGRVWNDNLLWVSGECLQRSDEEPLELNNKTITKGINCKVLWKESFIDAVDREGIEFEVVLKELEINRFKRVASKDDKVRISQAKRRMAAKTLGSMEEILSTPKLKTPLKLARLNEAPDGPVDMATVSSTVVVLEESDKIAEGANLRPRFEVEAGLLEEQCRAKAREKMVAVMNDEFKKLELEKEREAVALKLKEVRAESVAEAERLVTASATSQNNLAGKLYQLRYTNVEIMALNEGNYEEKEIMDEEEVEEMEVGLNVAEKTAVDNQETINQEIESSRLRVVDLEGLLQVEKEFSAELQKELDVAREREEQTLLYNAEYVEEYEALISQDSALNQLTSKLIELKEKAASGSRHEDELAEYHIRVLNEEISDMKCNIRALNEQLLKREIDLDTARTNLAVSEADFEKLSSSIVGKDLELRNSAQIRDSLIARLDRLKADLRRLKGREAQSRADLAEIKPRTKVWWTIWPTLTET
ncbi:hypothetical protein GIB67_022553 [Kingdonia uniflora]|uniref:Uncharacterized protein n=1 Tax=Kingdonia uniflora TaxID=39325 RepID=A0A7J7L7I0_9MAGN|nr:hypothetical protein GIB67_022553 [Kingdonia uniflora]